MVKSGKDSTKNIMRYDDISTHTDKIVALETKMDDVKYLKNDTGKEMEVNQETKIMAKDVLVNKVS